MVCSELEQGSSSLTEARLRSAVEVLRGSAVVVEAAVPRQAWEVLSTRWLLA